jgi:hypothetical protein
MKIHDIISEAPGLGTAIKAGVNAFKAARSGAPAVAKGTAKVAGKVASKAKGKIAPVVQAADDAVKDTRTAYQKIAPTLLGGTKASPEVLAAQALKTSKFADKAGDVVKLAAAVELTQETVKYWSRSSDLDKKLAAGEITQEEYDKQLQQLRGQFIVGVVAPWAAMAILKYPAKLLKIVPGAMKLVGFPNAAEIISILAKRSAQVALLAWFGSDTGKKWLTDLVGESFIGALGDIPAMAGQVYDVLQAGAQVATGNTPAGFTPSSDEVGGGQGKYIDPFKGTSREGGL